MVKNRDPGRRRILYQPRTAKSLRWLQNAAYQTGIFLLRQTEAESLFQNFLRRRILGEQQQSAGLVVQPMHRLRQKRVRILFTHIPGR